MQSGEVWNEVAEELAQEGLRPVTPDQECLTEILHTHEGKAEETLKTQVCHALPATPQGTSDIVFVVPA